MAIVLTEADYCLVVSYLHNNSIVMKNIFYYQASNLDRSAQGLVGAFLDTVVPAIADIISSDTVIDTLYGFNLVDLEDFFTQDVNVAGTRASASMPPFVGYYFRYHRTTRQIRDGRKTFGVPAEADVSDGVATSLILPNLEALETLLENEIEDTLFTTYAPCIARTEEVPQESDPTKMKRVPAELFVTNLVTYERVSSQNSRKR